MRAIISRFAPAPTGFLHLGHVVNAVYVWGETRARSAAACCCGSRITIGSGAGANSRRRSSRISRGSGSWPTSRRCGRASAATIYERRSSGCAGRGWSTRAGARAPISQAGLQACDREPEAGPAAADDELRYPGTCRDRGLAEAPGRRAARAARAVASSASSICATARRSSGRPSSAATCSSRDRDGNWTYQFAATVDDYVQGVTLVIRGDDLLASTGRQIQLARLLGRARAAASSCITR